MTDITGTHQLGPGQGKVFVKTGRAGLAARAGHDLTIEITRWSGQATVPAEGLGAATVTADLDLGSLAIRAGTGGAKPLTDKDRRDIMATAGKILGGSGSTGSGGGATAVFASSRVIPAASGGAIEGTVTFHGKTEPVRLQLTSPEPGRYRGSATIRQTAFGITPYSGFFGALKLRDEVTVEFDLHFS